MKSLPQDDSQNKGPIAWMAGHSVTANLIMLVFLVGGFFLGFLIKKEVFPDFELDQVQITVPYPGASPQEVERGIILAIEEAVQGLEGVDEVRASAREGVGTVTVEMIEGENLQKLGQDIKSEVDRITSFPEEAEEPQVVIVSRKRYVVSLALYGDQSEAVLREYAEYLRDRLLQNPDITQVELVGVRNYEISVEISQDKLRTYNLTLEEVAQRIGRTSVELPGGAVKTPGGDILVRVKERKDYGHEFGKIPIITANDGTQVLLEDIADIKDGFEETDNAATYNGKPTVMIDVYRVSDQTPVSVSNAAKQVVEEVNQELPPGLAVVLHSDRSEIYRQRMGLLVKNGFMGLGLVFILLALFLEIRLAFWVALGIPISFLGSLLFLPAMDVSINMVSMFAFIVTLGTMSIVRGIALSLTGGWPVRTLPPAFRMLGQYDLPLGSWLIPLPFLIMLGLAVLSSLFLNQTVLGGYIYTLGSSERALRVSGVNPTQIKILVYSLCGVLTAIGGLLMTARLGVAAPTAALGYELDIIAAAIIGGVSLFGGRGSILGVLLGAVFLQVFRNGLILLGFPSYWQSVTIGAVILVAILLDSWRRDSSPAL